MFAADPSVIKTEANIQAQLSKLEEVKLLPPVYAKVTGSPYYSSENVNLYYVYGR